MITPVVQGGIPKLLSLSKTGSTSITVPTNRMYYLAWVFVRLVNDANVATRTITLYTTLVNTRTMNLVLTTGAASETKTLGYGLNTSSSSVPLSVNNGIGLLLPLYPGQVLGISLASGQAGDDWDAEGVYYEVPITCP